MISVSSVYVRNMERTNELSIQFASLSKKQVMFCDRLADVVDDVGDLEKDECEVVRRFIIASQYLSGVGEDKSVRTHSSRLWIYFMNKSKISEFSAHLLDPRFASTCDVKAVEKSLRNLLEIARRS